MLTSRVQGTLLDLETIQSWKKDPNFYLSIASGGVNALLKRDFAPLEERLESIASRMEAIPSYLLASRERLTCPVELWVRIAADSDGRLRGPCMGAGNQHGE